MFGQSKVERDAAFTAFMQQASPSLLRTAWLLCGDSDTAHDLVQAALVKTYVAWSRVRDGEALAYARRVLVNEKTDRWRRRHGEVTVAEPADDRPGRADAIRESDARDEVLRLLARLSDRQRTVVVLRYYCDLSGRTVADLLGISTGSVKSAASRGLDALRALAGEQADLHTEGSLR